MGFPALAAHVTATAGLAAAITIVTRHVLDAVLRLFAGVIAILARDTRPRADRALEVLRLLHRDRGVPVRLGRRR